MIRLAHSCIATMPAQWQRTTNALWCRNSLLEYRRLPFKIKVQSTHTQIYVDRSPEWFDSMLKTMFVPMLSMNGSKFCVAKPRTISEDVLWILVGRSTTSDYTDFGTWCERLRANANKSNNEKNCNQCTEAVRNCKRFMLSVMRIYMLVNNCVRACLRVGAFACACVRFRNGKNTWYAYTHTHTHANRLLTENQTEKERGKARASERVRERSGWETRFHSSSCGCAQ